MEDIYGLIERVKDKPYLYTGDKTLKSMSYFLLGASIAFEINGLSPEPKFIHFHVWVREKLHLSTMGLNYYHTLIEYCNHDEELALGTFFTLIEEYKKSGYKSIYFP